MRGKLNERQFASEPVGITPADAGKTVEHESWEANMQDHPRGCGENGIDSSKNVNMLGSPPRMRGKLDSQSHNHVPTRITPADAGKTLENRADGARAEDHPRGCGENTERNFDIWQPLGSPPRMRGKHFYGFIANRAYRITPADAGKTY